MERNIDDTLLLLSKSIPVYPTEKDIYDIGMRQGMTPDECSVAYYRIPKSFLACEDERGRLSYPDARAKKLTIDRCYAMRSKSRKRQERLARQKQANEDKE